jgi:HEAT repeat protein
MSRDIELAQELGALGDSAVEPLIAAIPDATTRWAAVTALGMIGNRRAVEAITPVCRDIDPTNRGAAVMALGKIGDAAAEPALIDVVRNEEGGMIRAMAIKALAGMRGTGTVEFLTHLIEDGARDVYDRREATQALGAIGGDEVMAILKRLSVEDPDEYVRKFAEEALGVS